MFPSEETLIVVRRSRRLGQRRLVAALLLFALGGALALWASVLTPGTRPTA
ncbi:MAG TPA: hypothetical protein VKR06_22105 [Ktedonosporobacter sp.]|nr:hypothetical protein [Ktedonosporobacter sp.]